MGKKYSVKKYHKTLKKTRLVTFVVTRHTSESKELFLFHVAARYKESKDFYPLTNMHINNRNMFFIINIFKLKTTVFELLK